MDSLHIRFASEERNVRRSCMRLWGVSICGSLNWFTYVWPDHPLLGGHDCAWGIPLRVCRIWCANSLCRPSHNCRLCGGLHLVRLCTSSRLSSCYACVVQRSSWLVPLGWNDSIWLTYQDSMYVWGPLEMPRYVLECEILRHQPSKGCQGAVNHRYGSDVILTKPINSGSNVGG